MFRFDINRFRLTGGNLKIPAFCLFAILNIMKHPNTHTILR